MTGTSQNKGSRGSKKKDERAKERVGEIKEVCADGTRRVQEVKEEREKVGKMRRESERVNECVVELMGEREKTQRKGKGEK